MCKWARGVAWTSDATVCSGGTINTGPGAAGFVENYYWTSSDNSALTAQAQDYLTGSNGAVGSKGNTFYVRPVRAF